MSEITNNGRTIRPENSGSGLSNMIVKAVDKLRRINQLKRHGKQAALELRKRAQTTPYNESPRVTAVLQLFNKRENIEAIVTALMIPAIEEVIILDDGSSDGASQVLTRMLTGKNHFVIRSNDLFEIRTYSRALDFARGEFVALLQDDDLPPTDGSWVEAAVALFERYPRLAILGGRDGLELSVTDDPALGPGLAYRLVELSKSGFAFVDTVNRAPTLLRRNAILRLGGIDNTFAPVQCDDVDLCLRAWKAGLQVGLYCADFVRDVGVGGMRLFNADSLPAHSSKNWKILYNRYADDIGSGQIAALVAAARTSEDLTVLTSLH